MGMESEDSQLPGMAAFIKTNGLHRALQEKITFVI
jgi:hypothetical protein